MEHQKTKEFYEMKFHYSMIWRRQRITNQAHTYITSIKAH